MSTKSKTRLEDLAHMAGVSITTVSRALNDGGVYMGIFNIFIVIPQILAASVLGLLLKILFAGAPIYALVLGGASFVVTGLLVLRVPHTRVALSA